MRILLAILFPLALLISSCKINYDAQPEVLGMTTYVDIIDPKTGVKMTANNDTSLISKLGNMTLYRKTIRGTVYNSKVNKDGIIEVGDPATITSISFKHQYFIHYKDQKMGIRYDSVGADGARKSFDVDSLLQEDPILRGGTADFDDRSILLSKNRTKEGYIQETYKSLSNPRASYPDSTYLIFDENWKNTINYTLSKNIDSIRKMKLVRIYLTFNPVPKEKSENGVAVLKKVIDVKIFNPTLNKHNLVEIKQAFEKFKQDKNSNIIP